MLEQELRQIIPPIPPGFQLPFYYASLTNFDVYYLVEPSVLEPYLANKGVKPALFEGKGVVSFNYQLYTSQFPDGANKTTEFELNISVYPKAEEQNAPTNVSFREFILGDEQTKLIGNLRVHVPCDDDIAIKAGIELFGEPKFKTTFSSNFPSLNNPTVKTWQFTCYDPDQPGIQQDCIFSCNADLQRFNPVVSNPSPFTEYGIKDNQLIACRWNILQPFTTYFLPQNSGAVQIFYGNSKHQMCDDMKRLIGYKQPAAVRTLQSPPIAIQSRAYYP